MEKKGLTFVFLTALVSGISIFVNKFGVSDFNPYVYTFAKNIVVTVFIFSILLLFKEEKILRKLTRRQWCKLVVIGFTGGSIPFLLFFKGLTLTSGAMASFIHKTMFLYVGILAIIFLKEKINRRILLATILLLLGNALFLGFSPKTIGMGEMLIFIATLFWALENVISKYTLNELSPRVVGFGRMFFGSIFIFIFLNVTGQISELIILTTQQLSWILITSSFLFLYVILWYTGLKYVSVSVATMILLLGSPITTLLSMVFLGDTVTVSQAMGMFLILLGVIIVIELYGVLQSLKIYKNVRARWS